MLHLIADLLRLRNNQKNVSGTKPYAVVILHSNPNREREILRRIAQISKSKES